MLRVYRLLDFKTIYTYVAKVNICCSWLIDIVRSVQMHTVWIDVMGLIVIFSTKSTEQYFECQLSVLKQKIANMIYALQSSTKYDFQTYILTSVKYTTAFHTTLKSFLAHKDYNQKSIW